MRDLLFLLSLIVLLAKCTTTGGLDRPLPTVAPKENTTRASMPFKVNNTSYVGTAVLPRASSTSIDFTLPKETVKLMVTTCAREEFFPYPAWDKPFKYSFVPAMYLENLDSCFLTATAFTKYGEVYRAILDFQSGEELKARISCNNRTENVTGVAFCQLSGVENGGLIGQIFFEEDVVAVGQGGDPNKPSACPELKPGFGAFAYQFRAAPGFCAYRFLSKGKKALRLTVFGYVDDKEVNVPPPNK